MEASIKQQYINKKRQKHQRMKYKKKGEQHLVLRFAPQSFVWKADILPLHHGCLCATNHGAPNGVTFFWFHFQCIESAAILGTHHVLVHSACT